MCSRGSVGAGQPLPLGLSEQGGTAATSQAPLSLFMHTGLTPWDPLSTETVKFHNCFSLCVSSAWAHEPCTFLYRFDSLFFRNGAVSAPHVPQRSHALTSSKCTHISPSCQHVVKCLQHLSCIIWWSNSDLHLPHYFDVTLRWHCHLCCCRNSHWDKCWNHPWRHHLVGRAVAGGLSDY